MKFQNGLPPKTELAQYVLEMRNHPCAVGAWNSVEESYFIAEIQCVVCDGEPCDCYYQTEWIEESDIIGFCELP